MRAGDPEKPLTGDRKLTFCGFMTGLPTPFEQLPAFCGAGNTAILNCGDWRAAPPIDEPVVALSLGVLVGLRNCFQVPVAARRAEAALGTRA